MTALVIVVHVIASLTLVLFILLHAGRGGNDLRDHQRAARAAARSQRVGVDAPRWASAATRSRPPSRVRPLLRPPDGRMHPPVEPPRRPWRRVRRAPRRWDLADRPGHAGLPGS